MSASSSRPWIVPSSPRGPWSMTITASSSWRRPVGRLSEISARASEALPAAVEARAASPRLTSDSAPPSASACREAASVSARMGSPPTSQRPSRVIPIGTTSNRAPSMAAITEAALASDTSCSPERPPNTTPTRSLPPDRSRAIGFRCIRRRWGGATSQFGRRRVLSPGLGPAARPALLAPLEEAGREVFFLPAIGGVVVRPAAQRRRQMLLIHRRVVRVLIALAIAQPGHEPGGGIAQMQRHRLGGLLADVVAHRVPRRVDRIGLRRQREVAGGLGQRQLAFGGAQEVIGLL